MRPHVVRVQTAVAVTGRALGCLFLVLTAADAHAQRLPIKTYTTADGLAHNHITRIVRDSRGFLWFCTVEGLSRFDGYAFVNFGVQQGLPHPAINDFLETRGGEYWIATGGGLVRFDPKGSPIFSVIVPNDKDRRARTVTVLRETRDGTIWVGTNKGLYRLDDAHRSLLAVEIQLPNEYGEQRIIADVLEDASGSLWIAAPSGLYRRWPDGSAARYTTHDGLPNNFLQDLFTDHEGRLWVGTRLEGFFRIRSDTTRNPPVVDLKFTYKPDDPYGVPLTSWVSQLFESSDRRFLVATPTGLVEFFRDATERHRFRAYTRRQGLTNPELTTIVDDLGGNLWLGSMSGALRVARVGFSTYGEQDGLLGVLAIFEEKSGRLCFRGTVMGDTTRSVFEGAKLDPFGGHGGSRHGRLGCLDGQRFDWFKPNAVTDVGWVNERVTLQTRAGEWWLGTADGLYRFPSSDDFKQLRTARPIALYTTKDGLAALQVFKLFEDSHGNVWVSTTSPSAAGLARWDRTTGRIASMANAPGLSALKNDWPARSFAEDSAGNVWIGFESELVRHKEGAFEIFTPTGGLPPGKIRDMHVDQAGRLWLASSESGLVRVNDPRAHRPAFFSYTTAEGLSSNNTEVITEDTSGRIYVGGGHGLDRLDPSTGHVKHFTSADGLLRGLFRAAFRARDGVLWFGFSDGLARLNTASDAAVVPPPVLVSGVRVRGMPQPISALGERQLSLPEFASHQNQMQFDFVGLGFASGDVLRYRYRLDGADADWSGLSDQRTVTYVSLAPGRYRFLVRAVNSDGVVSAEPAAVAFNILPPMWQRWWFLTLVAIATTSMVYALYRYRVARLLEIANMRTRIATDLHDDIGANLTRIALLSEVAKQGAEEDGPLASITRIARESVSSMSDIVWAINPKRESLIDLTRRMRQHADEIFTQRGIELRFTAPDATDSRKLGVDVRRDLLLIFKEAVNNAARHSHCSVVDIALKAEGSRLVLTVADNGKGFDKSTESDGQGLTSMKRRAQRLKGILEITSGGGSGTTVAIAVPM